MQDFEKNYPDEPNLGKDCQFWKLGGIATNCCFPKFELQGRTTCRGVIDNVCLQIKDGRQADDFTEMLLKGTKTAVPNSSLLPPGDIV